MNCLLHQQSTDTEGRLRFGEIRGFGADGCRAWRCCGILEKKENGKILVPGDKGTVVENSSNISSIA